MPEKILSASPDRMVRRYVVGSLVSIFLVLVFGCYGIYRVSLARVVSNAENSAVSLAKAIIDDVSDGFFTSGADNSAGLQVKAASAPELDDTLRGFLHHFNIIKIKVYDRQARIIYSTDPAQIGKPDRNNPRLANALAGRNDAKVVKKEKVQDFEGNEKFNVDVVETYVPVRDSAGRVIGSFELYQDVTRHYRQIIPFVTVSGGIMFAILVSWFQISHVIIRREAEQLKVAQEVLKTQANTDFLTGTCNRRQLLARCEEEMSRLARSRDELHLGSLGFIMIDIDHFKRVNDTYGHEAGDHVLRNIAERIRKEIRQYDIVGRYGGEEFLVILPQSTVDDLRSVAVRLWSAVRSSPFGFSGRDIDITVSLGVAIATGNEERHEEIIRRADDALYRSKNDGRDRISYAFPEKGEAANG